MLSQEDEQTIRHGCSGNGSFSVMDCTKKSERVVNMGVIFMNHEPSSHVRMRKNPKQRSFRRHLETVIITACSYYF